MTPLLGRRVSCGARRSAVRARVLSPSLSLLHSVCVHLSLSLSLSLSFSFVFCFLFFSLSISLSLSLSLSLSGVHRVSFDRENATINMQVERIIAEDTAAADTGLQLQGINLCGLVKRQRMMLKHSGLYSSLGAFEQVHPLGILKLPQMKTEAFQSSFQGDPCARPVAQYAKATNHAPGSDDVLITKQAYMHEGVQQ